MTNTYEFEASKRLQYVIATSVERGDQIARLAEAAGIRLAEWFERAIQREWEAAGFGPPPGLEILPLSATIWHVSMNGLPILHMRSAEMRELADALDEVAANNGEVSLTILNTQGEEKLTQGDDIVVRRKGKSVGIEVTEADSTKYKTAMTPAMARDLAKYLRIACAK